MPTPETTPVIVGIAEIIDRPSDPVLAKEPVALMVDALRAAEADVGASILARLDSLDLVPIVAWPYENPVELLCGKLGVMPARRVNAPVGGETPVRMIHDAAIRIARGESRAAAIVGAEAVYARKQARKAGIRLDWTPQAPADKAFVYPSSTFEMSVVAKRLGATDPAYIYPFYETASQAAWGQTPAEGCAEAASLWASYAAVAADNPFAWTRTAPDAEAIASTDGGNRVISWPYNKLMVANPNVNQASATVITSLALARELGVPEAKIVHIWGGGHAEEPENYLLRDGFDHSTAQAAALNRAVELVGGDARAFDRLELYSCFPIVPKMALRTLGLDPAETTPTVAGGLTFFGGPMNNYMGHAACTMVRLLRDNPEEIGLLYGQGGYFNKHSTLVLSHRPAAAPLAYDYSVQSEAEAARGRVPALREDYQGPATIEAFTVPFGTDGTPLHGIVVTRTPEGDRVMARVPYWDAESMAALLSTERTPVGTSGRIRIDTFNKPTWEIGEAPRKRQPKSLRVEREGPLTIITIDRPESLNSLTGEGNAEFAELFDDFARDPDQWVAIITGAGERAFSSGNDLKWTAHAMGRGEKHELPKSGFAGMTGRFDLDKPVIAAVNGVAMGGGFELALACDLIIASSNAVFALPEPKVGVAALAGGLIRLPKQIGMKKAMGMILTGRSVSAAEGFELGFVNEVTEPGELMAAARRWAQAIMDCSPMSIRASKQIARLAFDTPAADVAYAEQTRHPAVRALFRSSDIHEGPLAFAQKRKPQWKGR